MTNSVEDIRLKAKRGLAWSAAERWVSQIFNFLGVVLLARLLSPESFGIVATAAIFISACVLLVEQGLGDALVQRRDLQDVHYSSVFWLNLLVATLCSGAIFAFSNTLSVWMKMPELAGILRYLSIVPIINASYRVQEAQLRRNMDFRGLAIRRIASSFAGLAAGASMALAGWGAFSLVVQQVVAETVGAVVLWSASGWKPSWSFSLSRIGELFGFSLSIFALSLVTLVQTRVDDLAISINLGASVLGVYTIGYGFLRAINAAFAGVILRVTYSQFCRLQSDEPGMKRAFKEMFKLTAFSGCLVFGLLAAQAHQVIIAFFGPKWLDAATVLQILTISAVFQLPTSFLMLFLRSLGMASVNLMFMLGVVATLAVGVFALAPQGVVAVALVVSSVTALGFFAATVIASRVSSFRLEWIIRPFVIACVAAVLAAAASHLAGAIGHRLPVEVQLIVGSALGALIYVGVLGVADGEFRNWAIKSLRALGDGRI